MDHAMNSNLEQEAKQAAAQGFQQAFDQVVDRSKTHCTKYEKYAGRDILPLWVADMDFRSPAPIIEALQKRVDHGIFGYTLPPPDLEEVIIERLQRLYQWQVSAEDIVFMPGVVPGLNMACRGLLHEGEAAVTATPVYYPFLEAPKLQSRELIHLPVETTADGFRFPLKALDAEARGHARLLMLCNPFNPVGRALDRDELTQIAMICEREDLLICSDEIHCDLLLDGRQHIPIATISADAASRTVTLLAPSKTFNIAGLGGSFAVIQNPVLRARFNAAGEGVLPGLSLLAYEAMLAAYRDCADWHAGLLTYLQGNRDYLTEALNALPGIHMHAVEATYLAWIDVSALGLNNPASFFESHGLGLSKGEQFSGEGFVRLNFGCPRSILVQAVERFKKALQQV
ncbi:MAG: cystathionine beta-lyase [Candidatus Azotimanducaceae bacterium]|jgi:cystathionine beta-lyase